MSTSTDFETEYLRTWTEADPTRRREVIESVWRPDGRMSVSSLDITVEGVDEIAAHIGRVHDELIAQKGLRFVYDQRIDSGDATLLRWSIQAATGDVVGRGADVVFRDEKGRVATAYMFMDVD